MFKRFLIATGALVLIVAVLGAVKAAQIQEASSQSHVPPPSAVSTAEAIRENWHPHLRTIGTIAPVQGVTLSAEVEGVVTRIAAENGTLVREGDLLVELDSSVERAQLKAAQARAALAKLELDRAAGLREKNTISQAELDAASAAFDQAQAEVAGVQAAIDKKFIRAPFAGRVGIRHVNLGQYVSRGTPLLPLQQSDPVFVNFNLPQRQLPLVGIGNIVEVVIDAFPNQPFQAKVTAINPQVDPATRTVAIQATLPNPQELLRAGMFAHVDVVLPDEEAVTVVPATAIAYAPYGNSVYVVEMMPGPDGKEYLGVRQQPVKLGTKRGDLIAVTDGLEPGDRVATSGIFKLRNAAPVQINNEVTPSSDPSPKPVNS